LGVTAGRGGGIARVVVLADDGAVFGREHGQVTAQVVLAEVGETLVGAKTGGVVVDGVAGVGAAAPLLVDEVATPRPPPPPRPAIHALAVVLGLAQFVAPLVDAVRRIVERVVDVVVVDGQPHGAIQQAAAAVLDDLPQQIPTVADGRGRDGRVAASGQDRLHVADGGAGDMVDGVGRELAAFPLGRHIRLVVEFEIAHAHGHVLLHLLDLARAECGPTEVGRVGPGAIQPHHRHDPGRQQDAGELQAAIVEEFDPLDAHPLQSRQPGGP